MNLGQCWFPMTISHSEANELGHDIAFGPQGLLLAAKVHQCRKEALDKTKTWRRFDENYRNAKGLRSQGFQVMLFSGFSEFYCPVAQCVGFQRVRIAHGEASRSKAPWQSMVARGPRSEKTSEKNMQICCKPWWIMKYNEIHSDFEVRFCSWWTLFLFFFVLQCCKSRESPLRSNCWSSWSQAKLCISWKLYYMILYGTLHTQWTWWHESCLVAIGMAVGKFSEAGIRT